MNITEERVCELYNNGRNSNELATIAGVSSFKILSVLREHGVACRSGSEIRRKYPLAEDYFDHVDCEMKAYLLGFLYADGCVSKTSSGCFTTSLCIHEQDIVIIDIMNRELTQGLKPPYHLPGKPMVAVQYNSRKLHESLCRQGCIPRKSTTLDFPSIEQVPTRWLRHFVRGYFDGDGTIYITKNQPGFAVSTSHAFAVGLQAYLASEGVFSRIYDSKRNCFYLRVSRHADYQTVYRLFYSGATVYLPRKKSKFDAVLALLAAK